MVEKIGGKETGEEKLSLYEKKENESDEADEYL